MIFGELQHVLVGVEDAESVAEDLDDGADLKVLRPVEDRILRSRFGLRGTSALEETTAWMIESSLDHSLFIHLLINPYIFNHFIH